MAVSFWYNSNALDTVNADAIVGNWYWNANTQLRSGWVLRHYVDDNRLLFIIELTNGSTVAEYTAESPDLAVGRWYHAVGVFDPIKLKVNIYIDGILYGTTTATSGYTQIAYGTQYPLRIGYNPVNTGPYNGLIDNVRIYNRALTESEITQLYERSYLDKALLGLVNRSHKFRVIDKVYRPDGTQQIQAIEITHFIIKSAVHGHTAQRPTLTINAGLNIKSATHGHTAGVLTLA